MKKQKNKAKQVPQASKASVPSVNTKKRTWAIYDFPEEVSNLAREQAESRNIRIAAWVEEAIRHHVNRSYLSFEPLNELPPKVEEPTKKSWWRFGG